MRFLARLVAATAFPAAATAATMDVSSISFSPSSIDEFGETAVTMAVSTSGQATFQNVEYQISAKAPNAGSYFVIASGAYHPSSNPVEITWYSGSFAATFRPSVPGAYQIKAWARATFAGPQAPGSEHPQDEMVATLNVIDYVPETPPPHLESLDAPPTGNVNGRIRVGATVTDEDSNLKEMTFTFRQSSSPWAEEIVTVPVGGGSASETVTWQPPAPGQYTVRLGAEDLDGNLAMHATDYQPQVKSFEVFEGGTPPSVESLTAPFFSQAGAPAAFAATARDLDTGANANDVIAVQFFVQGAGMSGWQLKGTATPGAGLTSSGAGLYNASVSWTPLGEGDYEVTAVAVDAKGNSSEDAGLSPVKRFEVDFATSGQGMPEVAMALDEVITDLTVLAGQEPSFAAKRSIEASTAVTVNSGGSLTLAAGGKVVLKPGFQAKSGSDFVARIDPQYLDTDGDGMYDAWEIARGLDANSAADALADADGDGFSNVMEFRIGQNPNQADASAASSGVQTPSNWPTTGYVTPASGPLVGLAAGELGIGSSGAATYQYPIFAVPGTGGVAPDFSLAYSSGGGNGLAGVGWSLSGLSSIHRGPRSRYFDGANAPAALGANDRFYLDGARLVLVSGTYGASGSEYRKEIDNFDRIQLGGNDFVVQTKSGLTYTYGARIDASNGQGVIWQLSRIQDSVGNYMTFHYEADGVSTNKRQRLESARYTGNVGAGVVPYAKLKFNYETRTDAAKGYLHGATFDVATRLKSIVALYDEVEIRRIELGYDYSPDTGRSRLTSITQKAGGRQLAPLQFAYHDRPSSGSDLASTVVYTGPGIVNPQSVYYPGDFNGDGRTDLVHVPNSGNGMRVMLKQATASDFLSIPISANSSYPPSVAVGDFNGDGLDDFACSIRRSGSYFDNYVYFSTGSGFANAVLLSSASGYNTQKLITEQTIVADMDGDGRADILSVSEATIGSFGGYKVFRYDGSAFAEVGSGTAFGANDRVMAIQANDDPTIELLVTSKNSGATWNGWKLFQFNTSSWTYTSSESNAASTIIHRGSLIHPGDFNGDGLTDLMVIGDAQVSNSFSGYYLYINRGRNSASGGSASDRFFSVANAQSAFSKDSRLVITDWDSDGRADVIAIPNIGYYPTYTTARITYVHLNRGSYDFSLKRQLANGEGFFHGGVQIVDFNADGRQDLFNNTFPNPESNYGYFNGWRLCYGGFAGSNTDALEQVTDGYGVFEKVYYDYLTSGSGIYSSSNSADYPYFDVTAPLFVVSRVEKDNGQGGVLGTDYQYGELKSHRDHGLLGFGWMLSTAPVNELHTGAYQYHSVYTEMNQEFPYVGMVALRETWRADGTPITRSTSDQFAKFQTTSANTYFPYIGWAKEEAWDLEDPAGAPMPYNVTQTVFGDQDPATAGIQNHGNITQIVSTSSDGHRKTTTNTYADDVSKWHLGRLKTSSVTTEKLANGAVVAGSAIVRKMSYAYHPSSGLMTQEVVEPDDPALKLVKTYDHDAFGNVETTTVAGAGATVPVPGLPNPNSEDYQTGIATSTTTTDYDARGRLVEHVDNALSHRVTYAYTQEAGAAHSISKLNVALGLARLATDANGLQSETRYDAFGSTIGSTSLFGTSSPVSSQTRAGWVSDLGSVAAASAPLGAVTFSESSGDGAAPAMSFYDRLGRKLRTVSVSGDGRLVYQDNIYDSLNRVESLTTPYYPADGPRYSTYEFDALGRVGVQKAPSHLGVAYTRFKYRGLTVIETDHYGVRTATKKNGQGWTLEIVDNCDAAGAVVAGSADSSKTTFEYDSAGRNTKITDAYNNVAQHEYDKLGRLRMTSDMDMGVWRYGYDVADRIVYQRNASGHVARIAYDALGRIATRSEEEGITSYAYDLSPKGKGKLHQISQTPSGYYETHFYDDLGRPSSVSARAYSSAPVFSVENLYDSLSRLSRVVYPHGFEVRNVYNPRGYLAEVREKPVGKPETIVWLAQGTLGYDAQGNIVGDALGNGIMTERVYSAANGFLEGMAAGFVGENEVQFNTYGLDAKGNLVSRMDWRAGNREAFEYDKLYRLRKSYLNSGNGASAPAATQEVQYDKIGNITWRKGLGFYEYSATRKHAVTRIFAAGNATLHSYGYDANGNMNSRDGDAITWTSFNMPKRIQKTGDSLSYSEFEYSPGRDRTVQRTQDGVTYYVGSLYEEFHPNSGPVERRHYVSTPAGRKQLYVEKMSGSAVQEVEISYFLQDHLGSVEVITDELGFVTQRQSYDAWGARRDSDTWQVPSQPVVSPVNRGFTDHEMLDHLGLVHMNGRIYDPLIGRFLSADPNIDGLTPTQSRNRYSYVGNNPLSFNDPSGYWIDVVFALMKVVGTVMSTVQVIQAVDAGDWGAAFMIGFSMYLGYQGFNPSGAVAGAVGDVFANYGFQSEFARAVTHGLTQAALDRAMGGDGKSAGYAAFASSVFGSMAGKSGKGIFSTPDARAMGAAIVGGTAAVVGGGKFANGAVTGMTVQMFNADGTHPTAEETGSKKTGTVVVYSSKDINSNDVAAKATRAIDVAGIEELSEVGTRIHGALTDLAGEGYELVDLSFVGHGAAFDPGPGLSAIPGIEFVGAHTVYANSQGFWKNVGSSIYSVQKYMTINCVTSACEVGAYGDAARWEDVAKWTGTRFYAKGTAANVLEMNNRSYIYNAVPYSDGNEGWSYFDPN